jgi:hypothetical protein
MATTEWAAVKATQIRKKNIKLQLCESTVKSFSVECSRI